MSSATTDVRTFTIVKTDLKTFVPGRYEGKSPRAAAQKAGRRLFQQMQEQAKGRKKDEIKFTIQETTRGSAGKEFTYIAVKHELDEPVVVERAGVKITISHAYKVRSCQP